VVGERRHSHRVRHAGLGLREVLHRHGDAGQREVLAGLHPTADRRGALACFLPEDGDERVGHAVPALDAVEKGLDDVDRIVFAGTNPCRDVDGGRKLQSHVRGVDGWELRGHRSAGDAGRRTARSTGFRASVGPLGNPSPAGLREGPDSARAGCVAAPGDGGRNLFLWRPGG